MSGIYYVEMVDVLRAAGCSVKESPTTDGWESRARSSGGFPSPPLGVWWHHTASKTSPANDLSWQIDGCDDAPVGNWLLDREGNYWPVAAGASNCAGKGGPWSFSRGTVPLDSGNTRGWQIEVANNGVGEPWPEVQIDAYFRGSNALNALVGNVPSDIISHHEWAPDRKVDPATASAVQGLWQPRSINSSGTWNGDDVRAECDRRSEQTPEDDDMTPEQLREITDRLDTIAGAQQADFERDGTFGPKADEGISQRSLIYDALGSIGTKLDRVVELLEAR